MAPIVAPQPALHPVFRDVHLADLSKSQRAPWYNPGMDRAEWLKARRRLIEQRYDSLWAPTLRRELGTVIDPTHRQALTRFLALCPPLCLILDARCLAPASTGP